MNFIAASCYIFCILEKIDAGKPINNEATHGADHGQSRSRDICEKGETPVKAGLCLDRGYKEAHPPNSPETKVILEYVSMENLEIKEEEHKIELYIKMRISWEDHRIKLIPSMNKSIEDFDGLTGVYIPGYLYEKFLTKPIWYPDGIKMENVTQKVEMSGPFGPFEYLGFVTGRSLMMKYSLIVWPFNSPDNTIVTVGKSWQITVPCDFDPITFPFDTHNCKLRQSNEGTRGLIPLKSPLQKMDVFKTFSKFGFAITGSMDEGVDWKNLLYVELQFEIKRILSPLVFQYYLPAAAIVFVSQISFIIPSHSIPGRMGLLATLFLTLVNLFINHMVRVLIL